MMNACILPYVGFYDHTTVKDMLKECSRMSKFNHLHVLTLKGVCLDGGPAPYIIMPFMANGSLLTYLRKNRKSLVISQYNADDQDVSWTFKLDQFQINLQYFQHYGGNI